MALSSSAIYIDTVGVNETSTATNKIMESLEQGSQDTWKAIESLATDAISGGAANQLGITGEDFVKNIKTLVEYASTLTSAINKTGSEYIAVDEAGTHAAQGNA
ncbi:hypothetical protein [Butyrivibrio sp. TB]|uniref:hypothetical protein n=1 Tax=Butyrivibrio sp. TB TaxID=1520809 RepID=UPI0008CBA315|nr:hypothetical protein [Butyrivibrio sp. TB]SEQ52337.1 hypothetical protein SAMN02910382_03299 [Butyrivibrio sp. TB]